jgi:hypothetical protein
MAQKKTGTKPKKSARTNVHPGRNGKAGAHKSATGSPTRSRTATATVPGGRMTPPANGVKIRMYRTGLGDCFLLAFPCSRAAGASRNAFYMLVDCGVYKGTPEPYNATQIAKIVRDIQAATEGQLDLLVITHEHWDHVSAFHPTQSQAIFNKQIKLGQLWMAWTENMNLKLAKDLHNGRKAARHALTNALKQMQGMGASGGTHDLIRNVLEFFGEPVTVKSKGDDDSPEASQAFAVADFAAKSFQTEEAVTWIRDHYGKGKTKFLHPGDGPISLGGVRDARIYILGPPEESVLIKRYNPSASGKEVYPKAMAAAIEASFFASFGVVPTSLDEPPDPEAVLEAQKMSQPFDESYRVEIKEAQKDPFFHEHYFDEDLSPNWRRIESDWLEVAGEFALQLDSATNNTSLAFALEVGPPGEGKVLLFPGDAQVGNWQSWFGKVQVGKQTVGKDMVWKAGGKSITAEDLLRRTVLYKVGHHGSHNATLRAQGLELMGRSDGTADFVAFLPVDEHVARDLAHYGEMPLRSLVKELAIRTGGRIARNDEGTKPKDKQSTLAPIPGAPKIASSFVDRRTDLYFEYTVPL